MIQNNMKIGGGIVLWSLAEWSDYEKIKDGLTGVGFEKFVPESRTPEACLKEALNQVFTAKTQLIRASGDKSGFNVVDEVRTAGARNHYRTLLAAKVQRDEATQSIRLEFDPYEATLAQTIVDGYQKQLGLLGSSQIGTTLVNIISHLGGTPLRPKGAVYWLPEYRLTEWQFVADVIEQAGEAGKSAVYVVRNIMDEQAVRCVQAAIEHEIGLAGDDITHDVMSGGLGERALEHRQQEAGRLRHRIKEYENILQRSLGNLTEQLDTVETTIAAAGLQISCASEAA